jgi:hypothetical protein
MALIGCEAPPLCSLGVIFRHTLAAVVHEPDCVLRLGIALAGQRTPEPQRGCVVLSAVRRLRILKRPRNSASRHRQRRSEREKDQEDSDDRHGQPQSAARDRRGTRRRSRRRRLFVAGRPQKVHRGQRPGCAVFV